ncbi:MAG TPA: transposase [Gemmataceae bacterium]|nr:transposase [Gemmataceae bacterium]
MEESYQRHLPHWIPQGHPIFLTWNLKGALPARRIVELRTERERLERQPPAAGESEPERRRRIGKLMFGRVDRILDAGAGGPLDLKDPMNASIIRNKILDGAVDRYDLLAWCVMANHVHVFLTPLEKLAKITQGLKGGTAFAINGRQGQRGRVFWQDESFDHWARDADEVIRIIRYIENNPAAAGLCRRPADWPWSSAAIRDDWPVGRPCRPKPQ